MKGFYIGGWLVMVQDELLREELESVPDGPILICVEFVRR